MDRRLSLALVVAGALTLGPEVTVTASASPNHGLIRALPGAFQRAERIWWGPVDRWSDELPWHRVSSRSVPRSTRFQPAAEFIDQSRNGWTEPCSTAVWSMFVVGADTIRTTMGRSPEECTEYPKLIWKAPDGTARSADIVPFENWNIDRMWVTEHYLVFGLSAGYEGGDAAEDLAFWHLPSGAMAMAPRLQWHLGPGLSGGKFFGLLHDWRMARIAEIDDRLVLRTSGQCLQVWPLTRAFASCAVAGVQP